MPGRRRIRRVLVAAMLAACGEHGEHPLAPGTPQLVVHAVLDPSSPVQYVLAERAQEGTYRGHPSFAGSAEPVRGATVTIRTPAGIELLATEDAATTTSPAVLGQYRVTLSRAGITRLDPGTYTLDVRIPNGDHVTGTATIPNIPSPATVPDRTVHAGDTIHVDWAPVAGARTYEISVRSGATNDPYTVFSDTAIDLAATARTVSNDPLFPATGPSTIVVAAVDGNYYEYYRTAADPFSGAPPSHLVGGLGVFGVVVPIKTMKVTLCPSCR